MIFLLFQMKIWTLKLHAIAIGQGGVIVSGHVLISCTQTILERQHNGVFHVFHVNIFVK